MGASEIIQERSLVSFRFFKSGYSQELQQKALKKIAYQVFAT